MSPKSTQALEEAIAALSERLSELHASMEQHHDSLIVVVPNIQQHLAAVPAPVASFPSPSVSLPPLVATKPPKLHMQPFDGSVLDWVFQAEQYFFFYQIPPSQRLDVISFYMKGETLSWFKWMFTNRQLSSWEAFVRALELCFGHSSFDNHQAMLFKLHQRGSVAEFQAEFERLCNRVVGLPPDTLSKYFISMLRLDIQCELREEGWKTASSHWMSGRSTEMKQFNKASGESPLPSFPVLVGNGATLHCSGVCHDFPLVLQTHKFSVSLYVIPIFGANIVLGVQWLSSLGTFVSDFSVPSMQFSYGDTWATLTGSPSSTPLFASFSHDGIITPSTSQFLSPILLVCKKDGTWRFCVDYHTLNAVTVRDRLPIPTVDELLHELHGASVFSKLDLRAGYHKICVAPEDAYKSAFRTVDDHFKFLVMLFSFYNASLIFLSVMNDLFRPFLRRFVLIFFDDILICSDSWSLHLSHLDQVLHLLQSNSFFVKLSKCIFGVPIVDYLGHVILADGVGGDPAKLQAIVDWSPPRSITELRAFLGLTGYYSRFVQHYTAIAGPLSDLLKGCQFHWSSAATAAFNALKSAMMQLPVLSLLDFTLPFDITTDVSQVAIGAVLSQNRRPLAFFSKKLGSRMQTASAYNREMYAISKSARKWRQYLLGRKFHIFTNQ
ncbi:UNVERIFIED_CONTAM: Retrovirus-related Pol polyprotein from transposon.6 [Sesamum radiatum]|uniref:Retrovirus-related Pol polyprotein from transposon.6 n=1 Tax=Sesamum radiatum TaxID=300843 RepID=A0AAW2V0D4_SESRA